MFSCLFQTYNTSSQLFPTSLTKNKTGENFNSMCLSIGIYIYFKSSQPITMGRLRRLFTTFVLDHLTGCLLEYIIWLLLFTFPISWKMSKSTDYITKCMWFFTKLLYLNTTLVSTHMFFSLITYQSCFYQTLQWPKLTNPAQSVSRVSR